MWGGMFFGNRGQYGFKIIDNEPGIETFLKRDYGAELTDLTDRKWRETFCGILLEIHILWHWRSNPDDVSNQWVVWSFAHNSRSGTFAGKREHSSHSWGGCHTSWGPSCLGALLHWNNGVSQLRLHRGSKYPHWYWNILQTGEGATSPIHDIPTVAWVLLFWFPTLEIRPKCPWGCDGKPNISAHTTCLHKEFHACLCLTLRCSYDLWCNVGVPQTPWVHRDNKDEWLYWWS